ncbi:MAG: tetratricopeptide repeat protein [Paludibacter sp.]
MKIKALLVLLMVLTLTKATASQGVLYFKSGFPVIAKNILLQDFNAGSNKEEASYYLGNIYFNESKIDSAKYFFNEGLKANPMSALNSIGTIMLTLKSTDPKIATASLMKIMKDKANKKNIAIPIAISYAYLYIGDASKALEYWNKARSVNSKSAELFVLKGDILAPTSLGDACSNYETAILYNKDCKEAYVKYARVYKAMNQKEAIKKLIELKSISPDFVLADRELGDIYYAMNDFENASVSYERYIKSGNVTNVSDLTKYSMTLFMNHDFNKSLDVAKMGLLKTPNSPAFSRLVMYNYVDLKNPAEAINYADLFFNKSTNPEFTFLDYRYYGQALRDSKQYNEAAKHYITALKYDATKVELWKDISDMYTEIDSLNNAIDAYNKYLNSNPEKLKNNADALMGLGKLYYGLGNDSTTSAVAKKSALLKADSVFAVVKSLEREVYRGDFWRARTNAALDPETTLGLAKPFYEQTLAIVEPKNDARYNAVLVECYSYLGYYTLLQKDNAGSLVYWNKILVINPSNATAKKAIAGIQAPKKKK